MSSEASTATVVEAIFAALQDAGRPAGASWGIAANGALDQFSYHYGNALVGNDRSLPSLETVMTDLVVRFDRAVVAAVTGASAKVTIGGLPARMNQAVIAAGADLAVVTSEEVFGVTSVSSAVSTVGTRSWVVWRRTEPCASGSTWCRG